MDSFVKERYSSFGGGIDKKIIDGSTTLEELAEYAENLGAPALPSSGRQEYLNSIINSIMFSE